MPGAVIVYPVIGVAPVVAGGVKWMLTAPSPGCALTAVGASGTAVVTGAGVTAALGSEGALEPNRLRAVTVNVYGVPSVSALLVAYPIRARSWAEIVVLAPPGDAVTVYETTCIPLSTKVGFQPTYAVPSAANAATWPGASGTPKPKRSARIRR